VNQSILEQFNKQQSDTAALRREKHDLEKIVQKFQDDAQVRISSVFCLKFRYVVFFIYELELFAYGIDYVLFFNLRTL
jgi:hypothetical protein